MQPVAAEAQKWIDLLELIPHPEGGFYRETYRNSVHVDAGKGPRNLSTAIYFLIPGGIATGWHAVSSDEMWHFYAGDPVVLERLDLQGNFYRHLLGNDLELGQRPQALIPHSEWQRAYSSGSWSLCGCTVQPGFDFRDFELISSEKLAARFHAKAKYISRNPFDSVLS